MKATAVIKSKIKETGRTQKWLCEKTGMSECNMSLKLKHNRVTFTDFYTFMSLMGFNPEEYEYIK